TGLLLAVGLARFVEIMTRGRRAAKHWREGAAAFEKGDVAAAEAALRRTVKLAPIWAPAHRLLGVTLVRQEKFAEAEHPLRMASRLEPRNGQGHFDLGMYLATCPPVRADEAVASFEKAIEHAPALREQLTIEALAPLRADSRFQELVGQ
ncbi:MAG: hypothetical protein GY851_19190, partial [bacterium]|nr:hypothetical protein [bacterium]